MRFPPASDGEPTKGMKGRCRADSTVAKIRVYALSSARYLSYGDD
jgi:hypothetical protein